MEQKVEGSNGAQAPKKARCLAVKSLYRAGSSGEDPERSKSKNLNRKIGSNDGGDENRRKRSKKEVSLSSLKKRKEKRLSDVTNAGAHFGSNDSSELKPEVDERPSSNGNLNGIGLSLDDNVVKIPKRKRGTLGRKRVEHTQESNPAEPSVSRLDFAGPSGKHRDGDPEGGSGGGNVKEEDALDDMKENGHSVGGPSQEQDYIVGSSATDNGKPKKSVKKRRKQREVKPEGVQSAVVEAGSAVDVSAKRCDDQQQEDDEENLEENAARMLSSRFDPSCTGFSSKSRASPSPTTSSNSLYFLLSPNGKYSDQACTSRASPNSPSRKAANRALRPRNQHGEKLRSRKRRHFYEIPSEQVDADWVLNKRIKVFWPLDQCWYHGLANDYDGETKLHHIKYDDRDEEWIDLQKERIKLLLLPGEARTKFAVGSRKRRAEPTDEEEERPLTSANDGCVSSYMDTEPIISWLARSSRGVKSSSSHAVKKRIVGPSLKSKPSSSAADAVDTCGATTAGSFPEGGQTAFHGDRASMGGLFHAGKVEKVAKSSGSLKGGNAPIVYYRKRFRRAAGALCQRVEDDALSLGKSDSHGSLLTIEEPGFSKIIYLVRREAIDIMVSSLLRLFRVEDSRLIYDLVLLYHGKLVTVWPVVKLEMLFVDSIVGLRLLLFEGCLGKAVAFAVSVLNLLGESNGEVKFVSLRSPITSVGFKFSCAQGCENQLVFGYYNFLRLKRSKRLCLESILRENCLLVEKLSPSECTYNALQNGDIPLMAPAALDSSLEGLQKMTGEAMWPLGVSRDNGDINGGNHSGPDAENMKLPQFALSFTAAPTFFLRLHLKLLMNHSVSKVNIVELNQEKSAENASILAQSNIAIDDCSIHTSEEALSRESGKHLPCAKDDQAIELVVCKGSDLRTPQDNQSVSLQTGRIQSGTENLAVVGDEAGQVQEGQGNDAASEKTSSPPLDGERITNGACTSSNVIKIDIPHYNAGEKPVDDGSLRGLPPTGMACDVNGSLVPSPNPTAPRSVWHHSRSNSFYGHFSRGWSDAKSDGSLNSFGNGPKKPRTHVTYSYPSGASGSSSKPQQRTIPNKRIRRPNEKRASDVARVPQRNWELLSCHANLLITVGDKGWRESGAEVVLELVENEWNLAVKVSGTTKYSHKAHQFLQPGSTNRYTHAMMWRGGKEWTLEFSDRSQWALFKEMHEECYNRNFRAASVKNIPIPGVRVVEDYDDNGMELSFRSSAIYFEQVETDVEMALNPSRVLYDMDSDDEQWISSCQSSSDVNDSGSGHVSVEIFERTMDLFEKKAYALQCDHFTSEEMEDLKFGAGPVVRGIYEHWRQKRQKKGMPLIRHLQPPLWEMYQQQLREWELALNKGNSAASDGCQKASAAERPPMFAFCMKPRGLEVPNKGSKQRSQKRYSVTGQSNGFHGDQDSFHTYGRRLNGPSFGDERAVYLGHNYGHADNSQMAQTSPLGYSPRDVPGQGYFPIGNDGFNRNYPPRLQRHKSKKSGAVASPRHSQVVTAYSRGATGSNKNTHHWNSHQQFSSEGSQRPSSEQWDRMDMDEYKLLDASGAARYASNLAKLKRERAQRLLCKADVAVHRAVVALMTAEAMKASSEDRKDDG